MDKTLGIIYYPPLLISVKSDGVYANQWVGTWNSKLAGLYYASRQMGYWFCLLCLNNQTSGFLGIGPSLKLF